MFPVPAAHLSRGPRRAATLPEAVGDVDIDVDDHSPTKSDGGQGFSPTSTNASVYAVRRRATAVFAKDWQLRVLKNLYSRTARPTEEQKRVAGAETGL